MNKSNTLDLILLALLIPIFIGLVFITADDGRTTPPSVPSAYAFVTGQYTQFAGFGGGQCNPDAGFGGEWDELEPVSVKTPDVPEDPAGAFCVTVGVVEYLCEHIPDRTIMPVEEVVTYDTLWYNETTKENVEEFITLLPVCPYISVTDVNRCTSMSRYIAIEGKAHGLEIGTCIILRDHLPKHGGHQINFFDDNGTEYYINSRSLYHHNVFSFFGLVDEMNDWQNTNYTVLGMDGHWRP